MTINTLTLTPEHIQAVGAERRRGRPKKGDTSTAAETKTTGYRLSLDAIEGITRAAQAFGVSENALLDYLGRSLKAQSIQAQ